jgi:RNA polymerase sigma factor (sigma-70 family)
MPDATDIELLQDYARQDSEAAFAVLVQRHVSLVYSTALRHVGIPAQSEEITQAVFVILARKAGGLRPDTVLEAWLYETTRLVSLNFLRGERRRQSREQEAYMQSTIQESNDVSTWNQLAPLLDDAIARLGKKDREAVVLRFFKEKKLREVALAMNMTETAAQSRVHRALEKLRGYFSKQGVHSTTAFIAGEISARSVHAAPAGLANSISAVALAKGAAASASTLALVKGALKIMAWTNTKTALVVGLGILLAGTAIVTVEEIRGHTNLSNTHGRNLPAQMSLLVTSEFAEVPDKLLEDKDVQWQPADSGESTAMLSTMQQSNMIRGFKRNREVAIVGRIGISFAPVPVKTNVATVSMTSSANVDGSNTPMRSTCHVTALLSSDSNSVLVRLDATWRPSAANESSATKADAEATLSLNPSQTILIRSPINDNRPADVSKSLLIFVTPQLAKLQQRLQRITPAKSQ